VKRARKPAGRLTQAERDRLLNAAKAADAGVQPGERCGNPMLDAERRRTLCGAPAVAEREVPFDFSDAKVRTTFCAKHAAAVDANGGEMKIDRSAADAAHDAEVRARWDAEQAKLPSHERRTLEQAEAEEEAHVGRQLRRGRDRGEL
jgi:hypothetical protein